MRELSLHILDLIENAIRAEASVVEVLVAADPATDRLRIVVSDNGKGLQVSPQDAANPFYTTKQGKRTGLGLSLFRGAAEATGGSLEIGRSAAGGVEVTVEMGLSHVDRSPLGDLAGTLSAVVCTNPGIDFRFGLRAGDRERWIRVVELAETLGPRGSDTLVVARRVKEEIKAELCGSGALE